MAIKTTTRKLNIDIKATDSFSATFSNVSNLAKSTASAITSSFKTATIAVVGTGAAVFAAQGAIVAFTSSVAKFDDEVTKISARIGISTEALSEYRLVAELSGLTFETMAVALQKGVKSISEATIGIGPGVKSLKQLGLVASDLNKLKPEEQFEILADAFQDLELQSDKVRIAMELFGRPGGQLLQTMTKGAAGIREMREQAVKLGLSLTAVEGKNAEDFNDQFLLLTETFRGLKRAIAQEVMPQITRSFTLIREKVTEFLPAIKSIVSTAITVILNFPKSLALAAKATADLFKRITTDTATQGSGIVALITTSFKTLGPAIGGVMIELSKVVFKPLIAAFKVTLTNLKIAALNFFRKKDEQEPFGSVFDAAKNSLEGTFEAIEIDFTGITEGFGLLSEGLIKLFNAAKADPILKQLKTDIDALGSSADTAVKNLKDLRDSIFAEEGAGVGIQAAPEPFSPQAAFAPSLGLENELASFFQGLADDEAERMEFRKNNALSFFDFESDLVRQRMEIQKEAAALDIDLSNEVAQTATINAFKRASAEQAAAGITTAANKAMETQLLSFVETGKFSAQEFAKVVVQQTKAELVGISARAAVQALFQTGLGLGAAAIGNAASASLHFSAAGQFAAISGVALAAAGAVHQVAGSGTFGAIGGNSQPGAQSTTPIGQTTTGAPIRQETIQAEPTTHITIQIISPMGNEDWDKITREEIVPALNRNGSDNVLIDSSVIRQE